MEDMKKTEVKYEETKKLKELLYGQRPNPVSAAFYLKELAGKYGEFERVCERSFAFVEARRKVRKQSLSLLGMLKRAESISLEDLLVFDKAFVNLERGLAQDRKIYAPIRAAEAAENNRYYAKLEEQRDRENHTNYWTGMPCPKGPD